MGSRSINRRRNTAGFIFHTHPSGCARHLPQSDHEPADTGLALRALINEVAKWKCAVTYSLEGPKWTVPIITWAFAAPDNTAFTGAIGTAYQNTIRAAVVQWAAVSGKSIQEVAPSTPGTDITIGWGSFSGSQIGQTEYNYQVGPVQAFLPGVTIHIEDPSLLALSPAPGASYKGTSTTLYEVALHEVGHALGLGISSDPTSVMFLSLGPKNAAIGASDIAGIRALYRTPPVTAAAFTAPIIANAAVQSAPPPPPPDTITLSANSVGIYRFFDNTNGTQLLTGSAAEANAVISSRPDMVYEGLALTGIAPGSGDPNAVPIYRLFDPINGAHFFTASQTEEAQVVATHPEFVIEQTTFDEHTTEQPGDVPVYRFFDTQEGTHFFTSSTNELATIAASRPDLTYEGIAFYSPATT